MSLGKTLRLRRVFASGRAIIAGGQPLAQDPVARVRVLARGGADAVVLTPGLLEIAAEELGSLSVLLRVDGGTRSAQQLLSVQAALEMGAEGVLATVAGGGPGSSEALERFGRINEDARRLGMPVFAEVAGQDWLEAARLVAEFGADAILARLLPAQNTGRAFVRSTGRPFVAALGEDDRALPDLLRTIYSLMQGGIEGVFLSHAGAFEPRLLRAVHGLVHQGISAEEAFAVASAG